MVKFDSFLLRASSPGCGAPRCDERTGLAEDRTRDPPVQAGRFTTRLQALQTSSGFLGVPATREDINSQRKMVFKPS